jgi:arylsulfatase A-like enzyme
MSSPYNIIFVVFDAAARSHFRIYGYFRDTAPFLTSLAQESIVFHNAFCQGTDTVLSTASLFSALYPIRHNLLSLNHRMPSRIRTLAQVLKERVEIAAAYVTIPHLAKELGFSRGFDNYFQLFLEPGFFPQRELTSNEISLPVLTWLEENRGNSFFLYLHLWQPHEPYGAPHPFTKLYDPHYTGKIRDGSLKTLKDVENRSLKITKRGMEHLKALYDEGLRFADYQLQKIVQKLCQLNIFDNTILIITSDHGEGFLQHGRMLHSSTVYEELIQIPLIIKLPRSLKPINRKIAALVESIDIIPTLLELLEISYQLDYFDGKSLTPLFLTLESSGKECIFSRSAGDYPLLCMRNEKYKYILHLNRYEKYNDFSQDELYDLRKDQDEKKNLIRAHPRVAARLRNQLLKWMEEKSKIQYKPEESQVEEKIKSQLRALGYLE